MTTSRTTAENQLPEPERVRAVFARLLKTDPAQAVGYLYDLGISSGYIKEAANAGTIRWESESLYGTLECTINKAKPEKDPHAIATAAATSQAADPRAPLCDLCWENEGFSGTPDHPAKPGLRIAAVTLGGERWGLQYSPYAYFPEHCIALSEAHRPMSIDRACFERLLDFVDLLPFYFVGSNADLPIVGGSILSHDHFQGGRHVFPLMNAPVERDIVFANEPEVRCGIVRWPASVIRLASDNRTALERAAARVLAVWRGFSNEACDIAPASGDTPHNTLNPIVHKTETGYCMDLVLRNNRTDDLHPWGIFHPQASLHHIKKENIGLIEIMGLAILPPRLATELPSVQCKLIDAAQKGASPSDLKARLLLDDATNPHAAWAADILARRGAELIDASAQDADPAAPLLHAADLHPVMRQEIALVFVRILETTGVFKRNDQGKLGWNAFVEALERADEEGPGTLSARS